MRLYSSMLALKPPVHGLAAVVHRNLIVDPRGFIDNLRECRLLEDSEVFV